jgi:hypothetical protein
MAEAIATLQEAVSKAAVEAAKEEAVDEVAGDSEALAEAEVETIVREAATQGIGPANSRAPFSRVQTTPYLLYF